MNSVATSTRCMQTDTVTKATAAQQETATARGKRTKRAHTRCEVLHDGRKDLRLEHAPDLVLGLGHRDKVRPVEHARHALNREQALRERGRHALARAVKVRAARLRTRRGTLIF